MWYTWRRESDLLVFSLMSGCVPLIQTPNLQPCNHKSPSSRIAGSNLSGCHDGYLATISRSASELPSKLYMVLSSRWENNSWPTSLSYHWQHPCDVLNPIVRRSNCFAPIPPGTFGDIIFFGCPGPFITLFLPCPALINHCNPLISECPALF